MAKLGINTGTTPNDGTGDSLLDGAVKINSNFNDLYTLLGDGSNLPSGIVTTMAAGSNINVSSATGAVTVSATGLLAPADDGSALTGIVTGIVAGDNITVSGSTGTVTVTGVAATTNVVTNNLTAQGITTVTNQIQVRSNDSTPGRIDYYCESNNAHYTRLQAPPHASYSGNNTVTLPVATGTLLNTDGDGSALSGIVTGITAGSNITVSNSGGTYTIAASGGGGGGGAGSLVIGYGSTTGDTPVVVGTATTINFVGTGYTVSVANSVATVSNLGMGFTSLQFTSAGYATTISAGSQISYTATANDGNARFFIEDAPAGLGQIGINYTSGVMGGGQNASPGTYDVTLRAATLFGLSEPFKVRFVVESLTLTMNNMFGDPTSFVMQTDDNDDAVYTSLSSGGVVSYDGSNYVIDRSNSNYSTATKHALYYDNTNNVLYGFRTASNNASIFGINKWTSVTDASDGVTVGSGQLITWESFATTGAVSNASGIHTTSGGSGIAAYQPGGNYTNFYGGAFAMKITTTGGLMNNFGTKASPNNGWAYGFTLEDPWLATGSANQMLTPESASDGWHNFGLAIFNIGSTEYDYVSYGSDGYGPYNTGTGVSRSRVSNTNNIANAGDTVQVRWDGTNYILYINGTSVSSTTGQSTYMSSSGTTNPVLTFGDTSAQNGGTIINDYAEGNPWPFRIRDLWIANNGNISASDVGAAATFTSRNLATWDQYSDVDVYITMDENGVTAVKGSPTVERKSITFS